ncbi:MAG: cytochrome c oxidase assembly protein [Caldilineales bacterium]
MTQALLLSWDIRLIVLIGLAIPALLYLRGWRYLRTVTRAQRDPARANPRAALVAGWKPAAYLGGLAAVGIALMSPIDVLGGQLFLMHMIQHLVLIMIAAPLLLVGNPFPVLMWGLPRGARRKVGGLLSGPSRFRRVVTKLTSPGLVWLFFFTVYVGWHDPNMYNLALRSEFVHDIEHLTFFLASMLFWWHVTGVAPRFHRTLSTFQRLAYVLSIIPANMILGVVIAFASEPIYTYYTTVPRLWGLSVVQDQSIAGIIMWIPGSMMYILIALILVSRIVQSESEKPPHPETPWLVDTVG